MSYAQITKGYRRITVDGTDYRWRFKSGEHDSTITLQGSESGGQQAIVTMRGVQDPWLAFSDGNVKWVSITPHMIRPMIQQALARGWQPVKKTAALRFDFKLPDNGVCP